MVGIRSYYVILSGEHRTLPLAELRAVLSSEGMYFKELALLDMVVLLESTEDITQYVRRAALVKYFGELITVSESDEDLAKVVKDVDWSSIMGDSDTYTVTLKRVKEYSTWVDYLKVINVFKSLNIGKFIPYSKVRHVGNVIGIDVILSNGLLIIGKRLYERNYAEFRSRDPQMRPIYRPGTLKSVISRVFVNLSRVSTKARDIFLDPFCGVGGFLIESCLMGLRYCGSDLDPLSVEGAKLNLSYFSCIPAVVMADACKLPFRYADGVGTDPPYGRLSRVRGRKWVFDLMECFIYDLADVIKKGGYLSIAQASDVRLDDVIEGSGFKIVEKHYNWVHGSLTRNIYVAVKI